MANRKKTPAGKKPVLKNVAEDGAVEKAPIATEGLLSIVDRIARALEAVERRMRDDADAPQSAEDAVRTRLGQKLSAAFARGANEDSPCTTAPIAEVPPVPILAQELLQRSTNLRLQIEELKAELYQGCAMELKVTKSVPLQAGASYGPSKDALLGVHVNLDAIEGSLSSIASYVR